MLGGLIVLTAAPAYAADDPFRAIEATLAGGRIGLAACNLATGRTLRHRADARFALCSTFKLPLVAAILDQVDRGRIDPDRLLPVGPEAANALAPAVKAALPDGALSVIALCEAAMVHSDNAAANLLLSFVGGPAGLTGFMRRHGGGSTRLDRTEPTLNTNLPGDLRDTTTPGEMLALMDRLLVRGALPPASRQRLIDWMIASRTGTERLRAGLPAGWRAGDKTGTGARGAANDIAIAWPAPARPPLLIASYVDAPDASAAARNAAHRAAAGIAARLA
jgi:beta-lactamase class A